MRFNIYINQWFNLVLCHKLLFKARILLMRVQNSNHKISAHQGFTTRLLQTLSLLGKDLVFTQKKSKLNSIFLIENVTVLRVFQKTARPKDRLDRSWLRPKKVIFCFLKPYLPNFSCDYVFFPPDHDILILFFYFIVFYSLFFQNGLQMFLGL